MLEDKIGEDTRGLIRPFPQTGCKDASRGREAGRALRADQNRLRWPQLRFEHAQDLGKKVPKVPLIFMKAAVCDIAERWGYHPAATVKQVEHEAELVVVIGKRGRNITSRGSEGLHLRLHRRK